MTPLEQIERRILNNGFPLARSELLQDIRKLARALDEARLALPPLHPAAKKAKRVLREVAGDKS